MDIQSMIQDMLKSGQAESISKKANISQDQLSQIISTGLPMIIGSMANNASSKDGADALNGALDSHVNSSVLDNADDAASDSTAEDGLKILGHIFGGKNDTSANKVAKKTGVDASTVLQVLSLVAPLVMAYLAKQKAKDSVSSGGLASILTDLLTASQSPNKGGTNGFGELVGNILGNLLNKK